MCLCSVVVSVILAAVIAALTLRVGGFYLGMVTLFIALVIPVVAGQWSLTGWPERPVPCSPSSPSPRSRAATPSTSSGWPSWP